MGEGTAGRRASALDKDFDEDGETELAGVGNKPAAASANCFMPHRSASEQEDCEPREKNGFFGHYVAIGGEDR